MWWSLVTFFLSTTDTSLVKERIKTPSLQTDMLEPFLKFWPLRYITPQSGTTTCITPVQCNVSLLPLCYTETREREGNKQGVNYPHFQPPHFILLLPDGCRDSTSQLDLLAPCLLERRIWSADKLCLVPSH